jgi:2-polyprenyl-6-methoxyphenol hydroxylase-like FAD-dependent oxidoreductase
MGPRADRQILVVGTTPTGLTLALLLCAAGYEPLLVSGGDLSVMSQHTYLSPAALEVLGVLDLGIRIHEQGRAVNGVTVRRTDGSESSDPTDVMTAEASNRKRAPPVVVPTPVLLRTLRDAVPTAVTTQDRAIDSIARRAAGVTVTFDDGVRESFDVVVGVGGRTEPLRSDDQGTDSVFQQYETVVDTAIEGQSVRDVWTPEAVAQRLPGAAGDLVRITLPDTGADDRNARAAVSNLHWVPDSGAFERRRVLQRRLPDGDLPKVWWGDGRVARCGLAACPAAPAAGVGQSLGITDALGLVSALARDVGASTAVETYATARARRLDELRRAVTRVDSRVSAPYVADPPFGSLHALRAIALEPFLGTAPKPLGASVPG